MTMQADRPLHAANVLKKTLPVWQAGQGAAMLQATRHASESTCQSSHVSEQQASSALAALLTHISHSHAALVQQLTEQDTHHLPASHAALPTSPSSQMPSSSSHVSIAGKHADAASECTSQQHASSKDQGCPGTSSYAHGAASVKLCPFQEELVERVMQADNTVVFLPAGIPHENRCMCP